MLVDSLLKKDKKAAARLITLIENDEADPETLKALHMNATETHIIGVTGPPGTGKSTLIAAVTKEYRKAGKSVGILAMDPTSPFTGGAILGDRIRMTELTMDEGVFIRSFASRGYGGGLARAVFGALKVLAAYGMDVIFVETVGAGQDEVKVYNLAHTNLLVESPGWGDDIQLLKAGILEIADVFVVNKSDQDGAEKLVWDLEAMLESKESGWRPKIVRTVAVENEGIADVVTALEEHHAYLTESGEMAKRTRRRIEFEIDEIISAEMRKRIELDCGEDYPRLLEEVISKKSDPHSIAEELITRLAEKK